MIFYVYLEPGIVDVARQRGDIGLQALIGILYDLLHNCFVADFEDERGWNELRGLVNNLDDDDNRKRIKEILTVMYKRNRFIGCLTPDYTGEKSDTACLLEQATGALLDLLLMSEPGDLSEDFTDVEIATLENYQRSDFARERRSIAAGGVTLEEGELDETVFLDRFLKKALRYATSIDICDRIFGDQYGGNYKYTAQVFFNWLEQNLADPDNCQISFYCGVPDDQDLMIGDLKRLKRGRLGRISIKLCLHDNVSAKGALPHDRFIVTNQVALGLPRGMDFLNRFTRKNRDLTIDYKNDDQVNKLIASYSAGQRPEIDL